ncbi:hypothetical protein niasHT_012545 [Heterodera trifolii]|uniref:Uncharacterized protein n=1 Tax=Heterodera trifolii TaxID=157864 RepID=A0ABD2L1A2_9BILA
MALLCAAEPDCMVPIGQTKPCLYTLIGPNLTCHRQDQSLLGILQHNMEYRQQIADPSFLPHISSAHPRSSANGIFSVRRGESFPGTAAEWLQIVKCC